ncbi:MAG: hypothetical protein A2176_02960 [Spirochaetes bacterium RBG_13_51_14]|nr:MAG: hypothetical protein A2176_02960 [Spirochaetes bacterium RBG_13_51_14]
MGDVIEGVITPDWNEINKAREDCTKFLYDRKLTETVVDALSMVVHELLENALKYGNFESGNARISYIVKICKKNITVEVTNPIHWDDTPHFKMLDKTIQWIRGYQNPFEAYAEKLKEVSVRPLKDAESGLGLVRVAYEGQSILDFYVRDDNNISVSAVYQLQ